MTLAKLLACVSLSMCCFALAGILHHHGDAWPSYVLFVAGICYLFLPIALGD